MLMVILWIAFFYAWCRLADERDSPARWAVLLALVGFTIWRLQ